MTIYNPGKFKKIYEDGDFGAELWKFLNEDKQKIRLETATMMGRPALEGVVQLLESKFKKQLTTTSPKMSRKEVTRRHRRRQMCGHMIKAVMAGPGMEREYDMDTIERGVRVRVGTIFKTAARYYEVGQSKEKKKNEQ